MASPWITYTPQTPPPRDVQTSNLADNSHTGPSELVASDASLVSIDSTKRLALGRSGRNPSVSSIPPFNSTNGTHTESTGKAAPILVSATSFGFEFREAGLSTRTSVDKQHTATPFQAPHSPVSSDGERYSPITEGDADIAAEHLVGSILPIHKHIGPQLSLSSSTFEGDVFASYPTKNTHAVAPISAAENVAPPSPPGSTLPYATTTGDASITSSPNPGASQTPTVKLSLTRNPEYGRGKSEKLPPKRQGTGGTAGSVGSGSIVQSRYTDMVFENVPRTHNLLSGLFTWVLLAGFVVLPGTFSTLDAIQSKSGEFEKVLHKIHSLPLCVHFFRPEFTLLTFRFRLVIAFGCCGIGACGMLLLWWRWAHNYVWLLNSIFVPGVLNGLSGVISTFASIYGVQNGVYGASSIATLAVTGSCTVICGFLTAIYSLWKLDRVKRRHLREMEQMKSASGGDEIGEARQYF